MDPQICEVTYQCTSVEREDTDPSSISCSNLVFDGVFDNQPSDGILTFTASSDDYINNIYTPGVYIVTITGIADGSQPLQEKTATFKITLIDPCDPPVSISGSDFTNQEYTLTDIELSLIHI